MKRLAAGAATTVLALTLMTAAAHAQETTGGITGAITDDGGHPLAGVTVKVTYVPTHSTYTVTTSADGFFSVRNLPVGGPYDVAATDSTHAGKTVEIAAIPLGSPYELNFTLEAGATPQVVTVTAARVRGTAAVQTGPRSTFTANDIQTLPSLNRDLKDLARLNPFVTIDPTNSNALVIAGNNNRYNTIYIDGVKQADDFGLNGNGYPTARSPISVDLVQSLNVEIAPYDVQYGEFQGGILSIVTKSGTNTPHGSAFYEYDGNKLGAGNTIQDKQVTNKFYDKNYGWTLGGPIIKDHLFFEAGYEKYETSQGVSFGPSDSSAANAVPGVTQADVTNIINILKTKYNYNPLDYVANKLPVQDKKWFGKVNWEINDKQRAFVSYQKTDSTQVISNDDSTSGKTLSLLSDWYSFEQILEVWTGALYSRWTPNLSTELLYSHKTVDSLSNSLAGNDFANFKIFTAGGGAVFLGPNISRQANALQNTTNAYKAKANYTWLDHVFTVGYEREELSVFNLFVQNATGAYTFGSSTVNGIPLLQAGTATSMIYANAGTNVKNDGGATWDNTINTGYIQDEWKPLPTLTLRAGLRYEWYEQDIAPKFNQRFLTSYGFRNDATLDGKSILMPRLGFNWKPTPDLLINGGVGLFSGGSPNVWISNDYTNTGNLLGSVSCTLTNVCASSLSNIDGFNVGASAKAANTASANAGTGITNALSPGFKIPSVWKTSIAARYTLNFSRFNGYLGPVSGWLGDDWTIHGDYIYQKTRDALNWVDLWSRNNIAGTAPDGRPIFRADRFKDDPNRTTGYDLELVNTDKGYSKVWEVGFGKYWANGWNFDITYVNQNVKDVNPGTSSVAASNYGQVAVSNPNNPGLAVSNYQIKDTIKITAGYETRIFGDNKSSIRLYATKRSGLPFSYTFFSTASSTTVADPVFGESGTFASRNRELMYVPLADSTGNVTATSDPKVAYSSTFNVADFNNFLHRTGLIGYNGRISPRNGFQSRDVTQVDIQMTQQIPAFFPGGAKAEIYFNIFNVGNMLNSNWGVLQQVGFPYFLSDVTTSIRPCTATTGCAAGQTNQYLYSSFTAKTPTVSNFTSLYALKLGVRYKF